MTIIYIIGKLLTFPGAYLKGFWEQLACRGGKCLIESDGYLRLDEACGHVEHSLPTGKFKAVFIAFAPGTMNFLFGIPMAVGGLAPLLLLKVSFADSPVMFIINLLLAYIGVSMLCNLFPLVEDSLNCRELIYGKDGANILWKILLFIPCVINTAGAYIERYALNVLAWAAAVAAAFILL